MFKHVRVLGPILLLVLAQACSDAVEPNLPTTTDVDMARNAWVSNHPDSYVFDVAISGSIPTTPFYRVTVVGGRVVSAINAKGGPADAFGTTIDVIWDGILASRANHQLHSAEFDARGVPIEADYGQWELDGGVHFSVRNFSAR